MKNAKQNRGPGRPMAQINIPSKKFTFADMVEANDHVTPLTLRKFLKRDAARKNKSEIVLVKDETREPNHKSGLGRKTYVYIRRSKMEGSASASALKTARKSKVSVALAPASSTADYEATKAALLAPEPAPTEPAPESTPIVAEPIPA